MYRIYQKRFIKKLIILLGNKVLNVINNEIKETNYFFLVVLNHRFVTRFLIYNCTSVLLEKKGH